MFELWLKIGSVIVVSLIIGGILFYGFNYLVCKMMDTIDNEARKTIEDLTKERDK